MDVIRKLRDAAVLKLHHWLHITQQRVDERRRAELVAQFKSCGPNLSLGWPIRLSGADHLEVGANVHIGENAFIRAEGGLQIGDNTRISRNLVLYSVNHRYEGELLPFDHGGVYKSVTIGRNVWIGMNVCIVPGTVIGDGAVVGMGTVVSGKVPPLAVVGSPPWRILKYRDSNRYAELESSKAYADPQGRPWIHPKQDCPCSRDDHNTNL